MSKALADMEGVHSYEGTYVSERGSEREGAASGGRPACAGVPACPLQSLQWEVSASKGVFSSLTHAESCSWTALMDSACCNHPHCCCM